MRYFDDIALGDRLALGHHTFTAEEIKTFAAKFDRSRPCGRAAAAPRISARCGVGLAHHRGWMRLRVLYVDAKTPSARRARGHRQLGLAGFRN